MDQSTMTMRLLTGLVCVSLCAGIRLPLYADEVPADLFAKKNLVAWCIVPFDSKKRGPEDRAAMLEKLGFSKFAYDYRAEHIPTFDAELEALKRHHIELTAWWFPPTLNDEAKMTLDLFRRHLVTPQLWVTGGGERTKSEQEQQQRIRDEAARIRPIAEAAEKVGCKVGLYNHGGWFGEPENQIAVIQELKLPNVGIVYNLHHGHDHLDRFPELLEKMKPYLYTLNLNGMVKQGDRKGQKILQLGEGDLDLELLKVIRNSGYKGPIGILGHTSDDAEQRLHDNLDGLNWLLPQLDGKPAGPKPKMRTPVPAAQNKPAAAAPNVPVQRLAEGKFGKALDGRAGGAFVLGREEFRQFPITVECWARLSNKDVYNILVAHELKSSGTHWELFSMAGTGAFTVYLPGFAPDHCHSTAMICDGKWHHVAMILEQDQIRLFVDGQIVARQTHRRTDRASISGDLAVASLVDQQIGCTGLIDEVRISRGVRSMDRFSEKALTVDDSTLALWHLDEFVEDKQFDDSTRRNPALAGASAASITDGAKRGKIEGHWGEDALGFRWTEQDSRDDRFGQMDTGPFFSGSITGPGGTVYKGIVVRVGKNRQASICYDTELLRASAGWRGFVKFDPARFGIIVPPRIDGDAIFTTPQLGGWTSSDQFSSNRTAGKYGGLPKNEAHYEGLYRHGQRVVLKFLVGAGSGNSDASRAAVLESPWIEESDGVTALSRTLFISPQNGSASTPSLRMIVADANARVRLVAPQGNAELTKGPEGAQVLVVPPQAGPVSLKLLIAASTANDASLERLAATSKVENLAEMTKPGPTIWGDPLVTKGEVSSSRAPFAIDTITLPFENPFRALMFCGGHDFLPDGRAFVCTLHGDVWLVDGIDETLRRVTWRRFATGLFQPLGVKLMPRQRQIASTENGMDLFVVGRDQITCLHDLNHDGEADFYENLNNDAAVTLNGHEYVTSLEADRDGNLYFVKGNCDSAIPHDGSLLRVSRDGSKLDVFATGFRNSDGIGIGPNDEITVAPQEGEWTPASCLFDVHRGGFYGAMMSHHKNPPPTDFERPICWFPRLADNSSGGQVWVPPGHWGPLANQLLLLSYGQCELRLILREPLPGAGENSFASVTARRSPMVRVNGGSTELPLTFASGIHRGRFNKKDGHLYLTGLKGWVTSAVNDGCFQRVRYTGQPVDALVHMKTYRNGIALTFTRPLNRDEATNIDNYQLEAWNYHWSAAYGSPDLRASAPGQEGRDAIEPTSVTLLDDERTIFLELPEVKPVDQLGVSYSLRATDGASIEQTAYLTINGIPDDVLSESKLHRSKADFERSELISKLAPGVVLTQPDRPIRLSRRMMAWTESQLPGGRGELIASGYLKVPATGEYRFSADADGATRLEIQNEVFDLTHREAVVRLKKGLTKIQVRQTVPASDARFRLLWESSRFPREAVPATSLFHERANDDQSAQAFLDGQHLFAERKCANCHRMDAASSDHDHSAQSESLRQAPRLDGIGSRLTTTWLANWIRRPHGLRADATMPAVPELENAAAMSDLLAYLGSLGDDRPTSNSSEDSTRPDNPMAKNGSVLFERLGCIACHSFSAVDVHDEWNRVSLHYARAKFQPGQLERYLADPDQHHIGSRMPNFHLNGEETRALAAFIRENSKGDLDHLDASISGDAERGKALFAKLRCDHCHLTSSTGKLAAADARSVFSADSQRGCLSDLPNIASGSPTYKWSGHDRESLQAYLRTMAKREPGWDLRNDDPLPRLFSSLRCSACHARDAASAIWPEVVAEEGSGKLPDQVPQLTWVGEKLQGPWIAKLLKGEIAQKPRPWITARMPSFPTYATIIAHGMASEHGVRFAEALPDNLDRDRIDAGRRLTLRDGGLDCRQCHGVGKERPSGDVKTQIALGINFAMTCERLRPEFAMRQLLDPPRYDMASRMPRFAPDLKSTAVKQIESGDAKKQFEAIQQYLWSLKSEQ